MFKCKKVTTSECWLLVVNGFKLSRPTGVAMSDPSVILILPDILM